MAIGLVKRLWCLLTGHVDRAKVQKSLLAYVRQKGLAPLLASYVREIRPTIQWNKDQHGRYKIKTPVRSKQFWRSIVPGSNLFRSVKELTERRDAAFVKYRRNVTAFYRGRCARCDQKIGTRLPGWAQVQQ